jgi:hypothetical protein
MDRLTTNADLMTAEELSEGMNKWDNEHTQHQACSEDDCNQFYDGSLDFCPESSFGLDVVTFTSSSTLLISVFGEVFVSTSPTLLGPAS